MGRAVVQNREVVGIMTWKYVQRTGNLYRPDGTLAATGYSGADVGKNRPEMQRVTGIGPIPVGVYEIGDAYDHPHLGPCVMNLDYVDGPGAFGRSLFRMHGDNRDHTASHGCVIMGPATRQEVSDSDDTDMTVVAEEDAA